VSLYRDRGVVLRTHKLGEADRIITFATEGHGKVRAVAKGVRKTKSRFGSRVEPMAHVQLLLWEGRSLDIVNQVEVIDHLPALRADLDRLARGASMLEVVDQLSQEGEVNPQLYRMLVGALRTLAASDSPLVAPAFFWKVLALEGYRPILDGCAACGEEADLVAFDLHEGGTLCRSCQRGTRITPEAVDLMRRILGGGLNGALAEPLTPATWEVEHLATRALEHHLERRLRAPRLLERG
jgi:DNA repair protein RecO (recombination protein O)